MKLNLKIVLPLFFLLMAISASFGYLLYFVNQQANLISTETVRFRQSSILNQQLSKEQEITEYNILSYIFSQDPKNLENIVESEKRKDVAFEEIRKYTPNENDNQLLENYKNSRLNINKLRSNLLQSIYIGNTKDIKIKYQLWNAQTNEIRKSIDELEKNNNSNFQKVFSSFTEIRDRITKIVIFLILFIILAIVFLFFWLSRKITNPVIDLSKYADEIGKKNFDWPRNNKEIIARDDESFSISCTK